MGRRTTGRAGSIPAPRMVRLPDAHASRTRPPRLRMTGVCESPPMLGTQSRSQWPQPPEPPALPSRFPARPSHWACGSARARARRIGRNGQSQPNCQGSIERRSGRAHSTGLAPVRRAQVASISTPYYTRSASSCQANNRIILADCPRAQPSGIHPQFTRRYALSPIPIPLSFALRP